MAHPNLDERPTIQQDLENQRQELLEQLDDWLETPMLVLGFLWLVLLVVEFIWGLSGALEVFIGLIWIVFIADFVLKFTLAPRKLRYLQQNWLTALALLLPALRVFRIFRVLRIFRVARATRGLRLVRVITSLNRGMKALANAMGRRGFGYAVALTVAVTMVGAAGMYSFEQEALQGRGLDSYPEALWWTAMLMTTLGSSYWPQTVEGRVLCFLLAVYALAVFGYVTATLATFFIGRDAENEDAELASAKSIAALHEEVTALRAEMKILIENQTRRSG